ncbi:MAG TPA: acyl-CoA dehydrogenase family protein [Sphingomicrobium sp.]|nr:acyl-CoA dehydrogenase family protein [Sphingomicrobium sp.]
MKLTEEQQRISSLARDFSRRELAPHAARWDREASFPTAAVKQMAKIGLLGMTAPAEFGGSGVDAVSLAIAIEEVARGDASTALVLSMANSLSILTLMTYGTPTQRSQWLPQIVSGDCIACFTLTEPQAGSDPTAIKTTARRNGERYILRGAKQFISLGSVSKLAFVFALTDPTAAAKGISCFLVPTDSKGFSVVRKEDKMGLRASDTCQIAFDDVELAPEQMLGALGDGYRIALHGLAASRIGVAAQAVGVAAAALAEASGYARQRASFGRHLVEHQAIGFRLADMATQTQAARLLVRHAANLKDRGEPYAVASSMAKVYAAEMCERVCSGAIQVLGGIGYMKDSPVERWYRDARVFQIYEGTNEVQRMIISRAIARDRLPETL